MCLRKENSAPIKALVASCAALIFVAPTNSFAAISTSGVLTKETKTFFDFGSVSTTAQIGLPTALPSFTDDFSSIGDDTWEVTWQAATGQAFQVAAPAGGWSSITLSVYASWGDTVGPGRTILSPLTINIIGASGDALGAPSSADAFLPQPGGPSNQVRASSSWNLTAGNIYQFTSIVLSAPIPASYNENVNQSSFPSFYLQGQASGPSGLADPGQWVSIVPEPCHALLGLVGIAAMLGRRRR